MICQFADELTAECFFITHFRRVNFYAQIRYCSRLFSIGYSQRQITEGDVPDNGRCSAAPFSAPCSLEFPGLPREDSGCIFLSLALPFSQGISATWICRIIL